MEKSKPRISVIMPVYNAEEFVEKTINCILNQTFSDFELLIIDDCGTDKTMDIIESINDSRIKIIRNDFNLGIAKSRNRGLKEAVGEYIALMDNDDLSPLNRFEMEVNFLDNNVDYGAVGGNVVTINEKDEEISSPARMIANPDELWCDILFQCPMANSSSLIRKSIITENKIEYHDDMLGMEDYRFWMELSSKTKIYNFEEVLLYWRTSLNAETTRVRTTKVKQRAEKFAHIQKLGLKDRKINLTEEEFDLFKRVFSEYKDYKGDCIEEVFLLLKNIYIQICEEYPEKSERTLYVLRNRLLEFARRNEISFNKALFNSGFGDFIDERPPLVSVIIPTYNRADQIELSINSVLNQTYKNIEIIICDDCSTDNTAEVVKKLAEKNQCISYYVMNQNGGPGKARNFGASKAKGEYVAFHDDDDEWHPDKLAIQIKKMLSDKNIDMLFGQMARYKNTELLSIVDENLEWERKKENFVQEILLDNYVGAPTILIKKDCFEKLGGFCEEIPNIEDWEFAIRAALNLKVDFIPTPLMDIHVNTNSVTHNFAGYATSISYIIKKNHMFANDRNKYIMMMISHIRGNMRNLPKEEKEQARKYFKEQLYPEVIKDTLVFEFIFNELKVQEQIGAANNSTMVNKLLRYKNVSIKLMDTEGKICKWLRKNKYNKVAIYGVGRLGKCLVERLQNGNIKIPYLIDRKGKGECKGIPIISLEQFIKEGNDTDLVIITPLYEAEAIGNEISKNKDCDWLSIEDLLR